MFSYLQILCIIEKESTVGHIFQLTYNAVKNKIINTTIIMFLGIALGTFSKYLDFRQAELPGMLMAIDGALDIHNFLGRFTIWVLIALCISIYSNSAIRASINVFVFFVGMVASYYLYSSYIAGFFPRSYAMIWFYSCFSIIGFCLLVCKGEKQTGLKCYRYGFFSRTGFTCEEEKNRILIELKELYK